MYIHVAVLTETRAHERRVALVPAVIPKYIKLGARLHVQAGAGIVADSVPEKEHQECLNKSQAVLRAIERARSL